MKAIIAERGQVTIPKLLRTKLGLKPGTVIDFQLKGTNLVLVKSMPKDSLDAAYGCLKTKLKTDEIIASLRDEA